MCPDSRCQCLSDCQRCARTKVSTMIRLAQDRRMVISRIGIVITGIGIVIAKIGHRDRQDRPS